MNVLVVASVILLVIAVVAYFEMRRYAEKMNQDSLSEKDKKALTIRVVVFCSALVAVTVINLISIIMRYF